MFNETIIVPNAPQINGLTFRHFRGEDDYPKMAEVRRKSKGHDQVDPLSTLESVASTEEIKESITDNHCNPLQDIIMVEMNGNVIGYSKIGWWTEKDGTWLYLHASYLLPEWRNKGIDDAM